METTYPEPNVVAQIAAEATLSVSNALYSAVGDPLAIMIAVPSAGLIERNGGVVREVTEAEAKLFLGEAEGATGDVTATFGGIRQDDHHATQLAKGSLVLALAAAYGGALLAPPDSAAVEMALDSCYQVLHKLLPDAYPTPDSFFGYLSGHRIGNALASGRLLIPAHPLAVALLLTTCTEGVWSIRVALAEESEVWGDFWETGILQSIGVGSQPEPYLQDQGRKQLVAMLRQWVTANVARLTGSFSGAQGRP